VSKGKQEHIARVLAGGKPLTEAEIAKIDDMDAALRIQLKRFLESGSLYRPWPVPGSEPRTSYGGGDDEVEIPAGFRIEMPCTKCIGPSRTFALEWTGKYGGPAGMTLEVDKGPHLVCFKCTHCDDKLIGYLVYVGRNAKTKALEIEKGGVYPSARPEPAPELAKGLGKAKGLFVKGLINQQTGFGVGAFAYYRRVAEDLIGRLLDLLQEYAESAGLTKLAAAVEESKKEHHAADKIKIVLPLVPKILRPDGRDPLGTIFGALSDRLHAGTDQECLDEADDLRGALEFVVVTLESTVATPKEYAEALKRVQHAKAKRDAAQGK
jgi:hypothetical protein